jgi:predicted AAA+ superfamily ATPase
MAISNHERVGRALKLLQSGVYPYLAREMQSAYGDRWATQAETYLNGRTGSVDEILQVDLYSLLKVMWHEWNQVFRRTLGKSERSLLAECQDIRNSWAHSTTFSTEDAYRALDSITRLLSAISAPEVEELEKQRYELLRTRFNEQARKATRRAATSVTEGQPLAGLKPWREIATPHPDVASGQYQQAEFAADLWEVYCDRGSDEYRDPTEFYKRTFLTEGLRQLLSNALLRLSGKSADPVIELQTNFGGGKTHAMLALYHLCMGVQAKDLPGMEPIFQETGIEQPPQNVNVAVLVGNKVSPGQIHHKKDGTVIRTLWGEMAYQLGGKEAYEMIREADETATNPGDALKDLFDKYSPCLILIDEWVAYARQLHDDKDLPAGDFDTHFTFAQTLSESAKNADGALLVVSIPASDIEIGGERGKEALDRLKNAIGRVESPWRPASAEESFEIVRRRLFQTTTNRDLFVDRDAVVTAFAEMYRNQAQEFPSECREASYKRRMQDAYPIHPELFDRLYSDWSSLDKFQRTRGVLRLMAKVIHALWESGDKNLLIMPGHIPINDAQVQPEMTRYLEDNWPPILERDVDGPNSLPNNLDSQNPNLGRYAACRRVTRTIYLGSAPTLQGANRGVEDRRIKLGCVQPGESVATFGDALRRLTDQATYLYVDGNRYWVSTQPNVTRTAQDRSEQILSEKDPVWEEITKRLNQQARRREDFCAVHAAPGSSADVPDDPTDGVRLVILGPQHPHSRLVSNSRAQQWAEDVLSHKGASPRYYKNMLLFLAPDKAKLETLEKITAQYLAWKSVVADKTTLNLDPFQQKQAETKCEDSDKSVDNLISEAYQWVLVPDQPDPQGGIEWSEIRIQGQDVPITRASRKLVHEEHLITTYAATRLCMEALDPFLWRDGNHIDLKKLWDYLAQYLYLPRLKSSQVLLDAVQDGVSNLLWQETFAYADGWDEDRTRYQGLRAGQHIAPAFSSQSLLVKPDVAQRQLDADEAERRRREAELAQQTGGEGGYSTTEVTDPSGKTVVADTSDSLVFEKKVEKKHTRFFGSAELDPVRCKRDFDQVADAVLQHLTGQMGAKVTIRIEVEAATEDGFSEATMRTVTENCNTLKFSAHEFEED